MRSRYRALFLSVLGLAGCELISGLGDAQVTGSPSSSGQNGGATSTSDSTSASTSTLQSTVGGTASTTGGMGGAGGASCNLGACQKPKNECDEAVCVGTGCSTAHADTDQQCNGGAGHCDGNGSCTTCTTAIQCETGLHCGKGGTCIQCDDDAGCAVCKKCSAAKTCTDNVPAKEMSTGCDANDGNCGGTPCACDGTGVCKRGMGAQCMIASQCAGGLCDMGTCTN